MIESGYLDRFLAVPEETAAVLCSLVEWKGSVPRKDYPVMLVLEKEAIGTIGGGRMEFEVIGRARELLGSSDIDLRSFDLTNKEALEEGSLCGGRTLILMEPFTSAVRAKYRELRRLLEGEGGVLTTEIIREPDLSVRRDCIPGSQFSGNARFRESIRDAWDKDHPVTVRDGNRLLLAEPVLAPPRFHIFGAGHVGQAVAQLAHFIDLETVVYDDREELLSFDRFPHAHRSPLKYDRSIDDQISLRSRDLVLIATPGHFHDLDLLRWALEEDCAYLGLISSRRKWNILKDQLAKEGLPGESIERVHSPVGLNIEAETVPEIAVSILAEVILHLRRKGKQESKRKIHEQGD
ncbi:MAG: XdhC family protein [Fidelibacterota bacterium]